MTDKELDFESAFELAAQRLRSRADKNSPDYNPDYEALVYLLAIGNGRLKKVMDDVHHRIGNTDNLRIAR